jgi:hypothetical protein
MKPREARRVVLIQARMRIDGAWGDVCIRNISSRGMLLQAATAPPRGAYVEIFRGRHTIVAQVRWSKDRRFGVHTRERMDIDAIINEPRGGPRDSAGGTDRRGESRLPVSRAPSRASVAERLDRSRRFSAAFEYGTLVALALIAAGMMLSVVGNVLGRPFAVISEHL